VITFGSFNKRAKLNDLVFDLWAEILHGVPRSRLYLKAVNLADPLIRQDIATAFHRRGIGEGRLLLDGPSGPLATLDLYRWIDIALDPFPFGGGLTTIDALWMGVPVVTKMGTSPLSRQSAGLLHQAGFDQWIAQDAEQYKMIARQLAEDPQHLKQLRRDQRAKIAASSLCDGAGFARSFGEMIMTLYQSRLTQIG
jgi:predicted O-linked N-acetylglucosamine transferase (SPINDLY family)